MLKSQECVFNTKALALSISAISFGLLLTPTLKAQEVEEIQVTGTRIRSTDGMVTPTPVTAVTTDELRDYNPASSISEQLDNLPQFLNTQTAQRGGGTLFGDAAGSYLNLRNMGKQRTLVLFDGSRVVPADRASTVNVDNFPTALVRTVDVVTGGASAAYGADALAGVVNFVLDREFEGLKASVSTGITDRHDGQNYNFSVAGGTRVGDRLHLIGSIEHRNQDQIERDPWDLDNWKSWGFVINPEWAAGRRDVPQRITVPYVIHATQNPAGIVTSSNPDFRLQGYTFTEDGTAMRPFVKGDYYFNGVGRNQLMAGGPEAETSFRAFNGGPFGNEVIQHSGFGGFKYDVSDNTEVFGQVMLGRTESNSYGRRGGPNLSQQYFGTVYRENAFLPPELAAEMDRLGLTSVRMDKLGQVRTGSNRNIYDDRNDSNISQMWSSTLGFDHAFDNGWSLRGTYQYGESKLTSEAEGILRLDHWFMAMDSVRDPATGAIVCNVQLRNPSIAELEAAAVGKIVATTRVNDFPDGVRTIDNILVTPERSIRDCAPLNMFGLGNVSQAAADYVTSDDKKGLRDLDQHFAELLLTGEVYEGWGAGPVSFAAGLTYREESFNQYTRPIEMERSPSQDPSVGIRGIPAGVTGGNRSHHQFSATSWALGSFDVWEWFGELNVPVWEAASGSQRLDSTLAFRQSDYSATGKIDSWKVGVELQVVDDLRLRVTKSRDVREPTFGEQFEVGGGGATITDPFLPGNPTYFLTQLSGGNPNLKPEEADTLTAGFVWAPSFAGWAEGFQLSADWYEIDVAGRVGSLGGQRIIDDCFAGDQSLCPFLIRSPISGAIERILNVNLNVAAALTSGVDIEARYELEPDFFSTQAESISLRFFAGKMLENSVTTTTYRDDLGSLNSPEWNATGSLGYRVGSYGARLVGRFYDSTLNNILWTEGVDVDDNTVSSQTVWNLVLDYRGETASGGNWVAALNINNMFDRDPPVRASQSLNGGQQGPDNNFDVFGRRYQISLNYNF